MKAEAKKRQIEYMKTGEIPNVDQFVKDNTRQVRWLFNNSNKCLDVVEEKKVRKIISVFQIKCKELEEQLEKEREEIKDLKITIEGLQMEINDLQAEI